MRPVILQTSMCAVLSEAIKNGKVSCSDREQGCIWEDCVEAGLEPYWQHMA
ncbi:hypothetical protein DPMN_062238 [Dreissena polymorpha]|uniref:Uncharacterized protein n=1 Tax=Dreissena polymorpha TaxID=45954 RepID=A0A9D4HK08_DREPO|nr:hypothetical protein DPMN_062238 [Dreissena polymorpha]